MPTIQLTDNTTLNIAASSADGNATLNRYLTNPLTFIAPGSLKAIVDQKVGDLDPTAFPIALSAGGGATFAVEGTSLGVQLGASASIGLLTGADATGFYSSVGQPPDPAAADLISFGLQGALSAGDTATISDFTFGITPGASVALTSFVAAAGTDTLADTVERAVAALTIPHDLTDLGSLPPNAICQIDAASCLKFTASVTYNVLNDPLATLAISNLPSISVNATAGATIEGTATHTSDHTLTIARLANGLIHLSVNLTKTDDFETSLTVSAGATAEIGSQDALTFLLGLISPNPTTEAQQIQADLPPAQAQQLSGDIKAAIEASLSSSFQASLKAALDDRQSNSRMFLFEINLAALDGDSSAAVASALKGDFTAITSPGAALAGIQVLDSVLTDTSTIKHSLALHLLGIFNWGSTNTFVEKSKVDYTQDTHEIVLSDETIAVVSNNLDSDKLRQVVLKGITLTIPASANTPAAANPINMVFFDRQASTNPSIMRQFVNVLAATGAAGAAGASSLIGQNLQNYGTSSLYLGLNLTPPQCRQLFVDSGGQPYDWTVYLRYACDAEATILNGDAANADRLKLFTAGVDFWTQLMNAGAAPNQTALLTGQGIRQTAIVDVITLIWWSSAMASYSKALVAGQSLVGVGKEVVKDSTGGFNEPWLVLAAWNMLQNPAVASIFTCSLLKQAVGSAG